MAPGIWHQLLNYLKSHQAMAGCKSYNCRKT
jgi:hypothetical protein